MNKNKYIKEAADELKEVSGDYEVRRIAQLKEKAIRDEKAALSYAIKEGIKQGAKQAMKQATKNML